MDFADFGRYLTQQRELRGMSRDDVSRTTKIPPTLIAALEDGQVDRLPARVFVVNYIRAYAQVIGLSADDAVLRFDEVDRTVHSAPTPASLERGRRKRAIVSLGLLVIAIVVAGYVAGALLGHLPPPWPR